jgi:hypothetical protein
MKAKKMRAENTYLGFGKCKPSIFSAALFAFVILPKRNGNCVLVYHIL